MPEPVRILIADDDPDLLGLLVLNLEAEGHIVKVATDGNEALDLARTTQPDIVVLDVMMPGLDGLEVTRRLREGPDTAGLPIVLLTARGTDPEIVEGWQSGANYYITKPFDVEHLLYFIETMSAKVALFDQDVAAGLADGDEEPQLTAP